LCFSGPIAASRRLLVFRSWTRASQSLALGTVSVADSQGVSRPFAIELAEISQVDGIWRSLTIMARVLWSSAAAKIERTCTLHCNHSFAAKLQALVMFMFDMKRMHPYKGIL